MRGITALSLIVLTYIVLRANAIIKDTTGQTPVKTCNARNDCRNTHGCVKAERYCHGKKCVCIKDQGKGEDCYFDRDCGIKGCEVNSTMRTVPVCRGRKCDCENCYKDDQCKPCKCRRGACQCKP